MPRSFPTGANDSDDQSITADDFHFLPRAGKPVADANSGRQRHLAYALYTLFVLLLCIFLLDSMSPDDATRNSIPQSSNAPPTRWAPPPLPYIALIPLVGICAGLELLGIYMLGCNSPSARPSYLSKSVGYHTWANIGNLVFIARVINNSIIDQICGPYIIIDCHHPV
ncbi:hypothetical protein HMN09_00150800 [Mycena chlorophos]|uniref:Uncharacterized protein n=1 Tax=Mycena chlorophos TaxID=658473 RepID=A0A8H6TKJ3_MYCCL|nr:hypothetical protein HMN09_00150800 [Mycena chlorophos]